MLGERHHLSDAGGIRRAGQRGPGLIQAPARASGIVTHHQQPNEMRQQPRRGDGSGPASGELERPAHLAFRVGKRTRALQQPRLGKMCPGADPVLLVALLDGQLQRRLGAEAARSHSPSSVDQAAELAKPEICGTA